jgi:MFS family permease
VQQPSTLKGVARAHPFSRDAKLLSVVSGMFAISFYGIYALLSVLYVLRLGYGPTYVGWFSAAGSLSYMAMSLPSGALSSRLGTRRLMLIGGFLTAAGMSVLPLAELLHSSFRDLWPIVAQVIRTTGWSMLNVNVVPALMAATTPENRSDAYAWNGASRGLGTFLGTIVGGLLPGLLAGALGQNLDLPGPYRVSLWVGGAICLIGLVPIVLIQETGQVTAQASEQAHAPFPLLFVGWIIAHVGLSHGGWATCQAFCNAYMDADLRLPASTIGLIASAGQFVAILAPLLAPRLAARRGLGWTMMVSALGIALSLVPLAWISNWAAAGLGRLGVAVMSAIWLPALQVFQMEQVEGHWRSLAYGAVSTAMALSFSSVSIAGGYIASATGYSNVFWLGATLSAAGSVAMWWLLNGKAKSALPRDGQAQADA